MAPGEWSIFDADDFEQAETRDPGNLGMELLAQVRNSGRIQDHFRIILGGRVPLTVETGLSSLINGDKYSAYKLRYQFWPRDIAIRRNSVTSNWKGVYELLSERDAVVVNKDDTPIPTEDVLKAMDQELKTSGESASIRWMVAIGDDKRPRLDLVSLPASAAVINGKPILKR